MSTYQQLEETTAAVVICFFPYLICLVVSNIFKHRIWNDQQVIVFNLWHLGAQCIACFAWTCRSGRLCLLLRRRHGAAAMLSRLLLPTRVLLLLGQTNGS